MTEEEEFKILVWQLQRILIRLHEQSHDFQEMLDMIHRSKFNSLLNSYPENAPIGKFIDAVDKELFMNDHIFLEELIKRLTDLMNRRLIVVETPIKTYSLQ